MFFILKTIYGILNFIVCDSSLQVNDQQPNVGVFWYFFMEMFEHFRLLFLWSYQMNVTILYLVPLSIKFRKDPSLLAACFISVITIFKSYPSIGDFALTLALLPSWKHLYNCNNIILFNLILSILICVYICRYAANFDKLCDNRCYNHSGTDFVGSLDLLGHCKCEFLLRSNFSFCHRAYFHCNRHFLCVFQARVFT